MNDGSLALVTGAAHRLGRIFALPWRSMDMPSCCIIITLLKRLSRPRMKFALWVHRFFRWKLILTDAAQIQTLFSKMDSLNLPLKVLINSAARMKHADLRNVTVEDWDATLSLNLRAPFLLAQRGCRTHGRRQPHCKCQRCWCWKNLDGFPA